MKLSKRAQSDAEIEQAWKEIVEALKKPVFSDEVNPGTDCDCKAEEKDSGKKKTIHHPAVVTNNEFALWELFG